MNSHLTMIVVGNELVFVLIIDFLNSDFTGFRSHIVLLIQREGDERKVIFQESGWGGGRRRCEGCFDDKNFIKRRHLFYYDKSIPLHFEM